jgi:hypothetical protein
MIRNPRILISAVALGLITAALPGFALADTYRCSNESFGSSLYQSCRTSSGDTLRGWLDPVGSSSYSGSLRDMNGDTYRGSYDRFGSDWYGSFRNSSGSTLRGWSD